jgi:hypothetical protein
MLLEKRHLKYIPLKWGYSTHKKEFKQINKSDSTYESAWMIDSSL